jgi:MoxR-like ATPase
MTMTPEQATWFSGHIQSTGRERRPGASRQDLRHQTVIHRATERGTSAEDFPGTGKTSLARAMAQSVKRRIQPHPPPPTCFPGDITGVSIYGRVRVPPWADLRQHRAADEINRASPKTQPPCLK